ncbi:alpha/beta hydrolase [Desulfovibrio sp. JC022]|uniref:alpha/beta hydrolase n=1 Tax=Desulfovibrio sp. JC022 TaxID=2593642 RepID=UPI0013D2FEA4|nr:alpha/beta hydrolase [Desulfovibrio sp. JC022]NDV23919.1 alpha/beta hydrolase [Desulfovibrio sp. JC022]
MKKFHLSKTALIALTFLSLLLAAGCSKNSTDTFNKWSDDLTKALTTERPFQEIELFYATDRKATGSTVPDKAFGDEQGKLSWGACSVTIPYDKEIKDLQKSHFTMTSYGLSPACGYKITDIRQLPLRSFGTTLPKRLDGNPDNSALIFVHGFNNSFEEAAVLTARMSYQLQYQGAPLFFSWPAQGDKLDYLEDEQRADHTVPQLTEFLKEVAEKSTAENIYLIGSSMGCEPLCEALADLNLSSEDMDRIKELILITPDINRNKFAEKIFPKLHNTRARITVYTSSRDDKLALAHKQRNGVRLGDVVNNADLPGIDFVDASAIDSSLDGKPRFVKQTSIYNDISNIVK